MDDTVGNKRLRQSSLCWLLLCLVLHRMQGGLHAPTPAVRSLVLDLASSGSTVGFTTYSMYEYGEE